MALNDLPAWEIQQEGGARNGGDRDRQVRHYALVRVVTNAATIGRGLVAAVCQNADGVLAQMALLTQPKDDTSAMQAGSRAAGRSRQVPEKFGCRKPTSYKLY